MKSRVTNDGGRELKMAAGESPAIGGFTLTIGPGLGVRRLRLVDEATGAVVGRAEINLVEPPPPSPPPPELTANELEARAAICEACEHGSDVTRTKGPFAVWNVKCARCPTCAQKMSLKTGRCVLGLWPQGVAP